MLGRAPQGAGAWVSLLKWCEWRKWFLREKRKNKWYGRRRKCTDITNEMTSQRSSQQEINSREAIRGSGFPVMKAASMRFEALDC